jgi:hypothetical protein
MSWIQPEPCNVTIERWKKIKNKEEQDIELLSLQSLIIKTI